MKAVREWHFTIKGTIALDILITHEHAMLNAYGLT